MEKLQDPFSQSWSQLYWDKPYTEIILTFNLKGLILKNFLQSESFCIINIVIIVEMSPERCSY